MTSLNLFDYATKELSQDAVICWLIAWAGAETNGDPVREELRLCGRTFVEALFSKWDGYKVELGDSVRTEVLRQERNVDILARANGEHVLLIEDKTGTGAHNNQLERYLTMVVEGNTGFGSVDLGNLYPIYCKTGNHSLWERQFAERRSYKIFDRSDFLSVLETYTGTNQILTEFRQYLREWQEETNSYRKWTKDSGKGTDRATQRGWEGLYRNIEETYLSNSGDDCWPLTSQVGGYNGLSIELAETSRDSRFAIWVEKDRISIRLYGSLTPGTYSKAGMDLHKWHWADAFESDDGPLRKPSQMKSTKTKPMCVAEWRSWLEFGEDGRLDVEATVRNLAVAREILLAKIRRGRGEDRMDSDA
ncbi:MAG: PD-(D/E)XK nuclease family protein [Gammaproteobacteria bacterium]|nr:PD-(D/E)XK nuclease family protein [Gammaproteobacteria bacterium]